jgi:hypothetical protein
MKINKRSQGGFIVTIELLILATVLVLGLIVGWTSLRDSVLAELGDLSESIGSLNQGYQITSVINNAKTASTAGSAFTDLADDRTSSDLIDTNSGNSEAEYTFTAPPATGETANPVTPTTP